MIRVQAQLLLAKNNLERGERLRQKNQRYLSDREIDALTAEFKALEASLKVAQASIAQAQAQLNNSQTNLDYCNITSPVDGVILERLIDPGQTLASQFQTPVLFIVAPDLRKKLHVFASVDESDIGLIRQAYQRQLPVTFNVDAYPGEVFEGAIEQIRFSASEVQSVITYPVVVAAANPDLKLLPGMTAQISFEVDSLQDTLKIPNAALRYYPENIRYVREADRKLLDGSQWVGRRTSSDAASNSPEDTQLSASERAESQQDSNRRHVWIINDGQLEAIEVRVGFSDSRYTVVLEGDLEPGMQLVTGVKKTASQAINHLGKSFRTDVVLGYLSHRLQGLVEEQDAGGPDGTGRRHRHRCRDHHGFDRPARRLVQNQFEALGTNVIVVLPEFQRRGGVRQAMTVTLTAADSKEIAAQCDAVLASSPLVAAMGQVIFGNANWSPNEMFGVGADYLTVRNWPVEAGAFFTEEDIKASARCASSATRSSPSCSRPPIPSIRPCAFVTSPFALSGCWNARGSTWWATTRTTSS